MGMFYKRRDYTQIVNGRNPIVAHEFLGSSVEGKDVIDLQIFYIAQKSFDKLVSWRNCLKSAQRDGIGYTRIVRIKSNDVINAHAYQFLKSECAV